MLGRVQLEHELDQGTLQTREGAVENHEARTGEFRRALEVEQAEITVGGSVQVTAVAFDADSDPLSYAWTSSAGQVVGTGETITFDASGLAPGDYVVRAVANDGRGGTSQSEVTITVQ